MSVATDAVDHRDKRRGRQRETHAGGDSAAIDAFLSQPAGLSTLDFLRRRPASSAAGPRDDARSADVRSEMGALASAELRKQQRLAARAERAVGLDLVRLGIRADAEEQRALLARLQEAPDPPETRALVGGRLLRASELAEARSSNASSLSLSLSRSAPTLQRSVARTSPPPPSVAAEQSGAGMTTRRRRRREDGKEQSMDGEEADDRAELRRREALLHQELLRVTQKMCRKYSRRLAPVDATATRGKTQELAEQWAAIQGQQQQKKEAEEEEEAGGGRGGRELELELDRRRHAAFVAGRFSTQSALDYYARELEPREPGHDRHRRHEAHTKYGDALARSRKSLRGAF